MTYLPFFAGLALAAFWAGPLAVDLAAARVRVLALK
jgi:hypothetical protein